MRFTTLSIAFATMMVLSAPTHAALIDNALIDNALIDNALIDNSVQLNASAQNAELATGAAEITDLTLANGEVLTR